MSIEDVEKYVDDDLDAEEIILVQAILAARQVQTLLWGRSNGGWGLEEWRRMFRKRVVKLEEITEGRPHAHVEMKKRLLQTAALSIALMRIIDKLGALPQEEQLVDTPSNLPQFADSLEVKDT
jgi:hypothetical protein